MNKSDLINVVRSELGCTRSLATKAVNCVFATIMQQVVETDDEHVGGINIPGFGRFRRKITNKAVYNPLTREKLNSGPRPYVNFKAGLTFKRLLKNS